MSYTDTGCTSDHNRPQKRTGMDRGASAPTRTPAQPCAASVSGLMDEREERLFKSLDYGNEGYVLTSSLQRALSNIGLGANDQRLKESMRALAAFVEQKRLPEQKDASRHIPRQVFIDAVRSNIVLIERALQGRMVIPDFRTFCDEIDGLVERTRANRQGAPADYIPQLNLQEPDVDRFAVALCTVDGQQYATGDCDRRFTVQSASKPVSYCMALAEHGPGFVHDYIGQEPSGSSFNELTLNKRNKPHNPMINAGALMSSALIGLSGRTAGEDQTDPRAWAGERFAKVVQTWRALCGEEEPTFSTSVYLSERETADRNHALAYFMREKRAFPPEACLHDVLDFYIQCCSIEVTAQMMSVVAGTLANGGICPVTGARVFSSEVVRYCLSMMSSCGMYDYSGEFAFKVGLPAKSSVSGVVMVVVPNVMGLCTWSPRLDAIGNSVRGLEFCQRLVDTYNFHNFDSLNGLSGKRDPRMDPIHQKAQSVNEMILAASKGDLGAIQEQLRRGSDLQCKDYDLRTPLHLAAAENQLNVVTFYIERQQRDPGSVDLNARDRWGGTPLDDAYLQSHAEMIELLEQAGAVRGDARERTPAQRINHPTSVVNDPLKTGELIWAASQGNLTAISKLVAQGVSLEAADYDLRTAMHLAAAEGKSDVLHYLLAHGATVNPKDRWGNTPLDEAVRHNAADAAELLRAETGPAGHSGTAAPPSPESPDSANLPIRLA